jgi:hypothetical protein
VARLLDITSPFFGFLTINIRPDHLKIKWIVIGTGMDLIAAQSSNHPK